MKPIEILIKARDEASGIFGTLQGKVAAVGAAIAGYFGISAFVGAVKGAAELEAKLSEVKAVSGATAEEMVELRKAAEDAGAATKFTATEGADALGNLTRAGLSAKDAIAALPPVLQLAQAGGIGLAEASEYVTKAVQGMGLKFSDAGRVADVLAMGANASNASVTGLAQALSYAAPVAQSLGLSLETTVAIIGKFSDAGIDASRAGTALNAVLSQFSDPSSKFRQELAASGIITNKFEDALRQLAAAGPAGEKAVLAVGTEAGPALRALLNQGIGALDDLKAKLQDATGSAAAAAAVMEDNLVGSINGLSSAWDTVKNALATPVLPVLRDGVTQLADALRGAVSNGTIGKFGDALATAFQSGITWARQFLATVDFAELTQKMQDWADRAGETFTKIGEYATNAGNIVQTAYGVMSAGVNTVTGVIYILAEAFAGVASNIQAGLALLLEGLSKITFGGISASFKAAAEEVRVSAGATWAVSEAFAAKAAESFNAAAEAAAMARRGFDGLTNSAAAADSQATASTRVMQDLANTLKDVGDKAREAGQKAQAGAAAQRQAAEDARAAVAQLRVEYEAAMAAGNPQLAVEKLQALTAAIKGVSAASQTAAEKAQDVQEAYTRLGVTSSAELKKLRDAAERDFKIIRESGTASASDLQNAWQVYAERAIAANGGVATETLKSEAAMRGLRIVTDDAGKSVVEVMNAAAQATRGAGRAASDAAGQYASMATAARNAATAASGIDGSGMGSFAASVKKPSGGLTGGPVDFSLPFNLYAKQQQGRLSADDLASARIALQTAQSNARLGRPGSVSLEGRQEDQVWIGRLQRIVDQLEAMQPNEAAIGGKPTAPAPPAVPTPAPVPVPVPAPMPVPAPPPPSIRPIVSINVVSMDDAKTLEELLAGLGIAATRIGR
ncbi:phage tail tape measure protein [Roseateles sp. DAIF2]|uniref:phage tail tape measure protein n=1 Tax=Roseateles sp. DAIF2 TaxID=2714952 RepID=UPI0018A29E35|nr:phage tail tape measure protein [Roseateles sp. DAIF2]QPF74192.1 phage tail tape measure protein [Roseateles sp. DAIF2]